MSEQTELEKKIEEILREVALIGVDDERINKVKRLIHERETAVLREFVEGKLGLSEKTFEAKEGWETSLNITAESIWDYYRKSLTSDRASKNG